MGCGRGDLATKRFYMSCLLGISRYAELVVEYLTVNAVPRIGPSLEDPSRPAISFPGSCGYCKTSEHIVRVSMIL